MKHVYKNESFGQNWFGYEELYKKFIDTAENGDIIVEVGVWKGKSVSYLGVEAINSGKEITIYAIDTWLGSNVPEHNNDIYVQNGTLYDLFLDNIKDLKSVIKPIRATSLEAVQLFDDESLHAVFIDADHKYEEVRKDIQAWYPKVKVGGFVSGHDCSYPHQPKNGVRQAVEEFMPANEITMGPALDWCYLKNNKKEIYNG